MEVSPESTAVVSPMPAFGQETRNQKLTNPDEQEVAENALQLQKHKE
jgi:hypothetical protein